MSTTLPHGIIQINEGNIAWYGDITSNWQLIDSKIGEYDAAIASIPAPANTGTLTINYGGTTIAMFGADDAGNVSANIPAPGDGTLTVTQGGSTLGSFTANQAGAETIDIPAPGDGTLTIQLNGTDVQTFTANQSTAATANITVPTAVSELVNDSGYLTSSSNLDASKLTSGTVDIARLPQGALERLVKVANEAARYALTTADVQLGDTVQQLDTGIMYVVTDTDHLDSAAGYTEYTAGTAASVPWSGVTGKPTFAAVATSGAYSDLTGTPALAAVATSGAYSDLTGTPTIPTVNNATLTIQKNGTNVQTFTANQSTNATANITVPTKTSDLTNDSGFITSDDTKIPLAGSNAISGSLIPATTDAYDLGGSSYQWNNAYIKSLTINGVACGDILTHNVSEFVDVSSAQTVGGQKTFSHIQTGVGRDLYHFASNPYSKNTPPANTSFQYVMFSGNTASQGFTNNWYGGFIELVMNTDGSARGSWVIRNIRDNRMGIQLSESADGSSSSIIPITTTIDLGTSANKWKDVNTVLLNGKTPAYSTDIPTKVSQLTNDSGFITSENALPIGSYIQFAGSQAPAGFLVCNGGAISRTTYSALFAVIGTTYGSGDGSTTFNLPNLTDRFLQGSTTSGTAKDAGLPNITGYFDGALGIGVASGVFAVFNASVGNAPSPGDPAYHGINFNASWSNSIYGNSDTVQPPALTCLICIKY